MRVVWLAALLCGCGAPPVVSPDGGGAAGTMTLGSIAGDGGFLPLVPGQDVTLVEGAQGGFHVWMKYRLRSVAPVHALVSRTAHRVSDGRSVLRTSGVVDVAAVGPDGFWELPSPMPMFMCPSPIGIRVVDEAIVFKVALTDEIGTPLAAGAITLVPRCPDINRDFCLRICTG